MWGGSGSKFKSAKVDTLIGHNAEVKGDFHYQGGLHVDGRITGNVVADDDSESILILSERGCIEGEIRVPNVLVNGEVIGDVHACERVELARRAKVNGNVYYNLLEMAMGAQINGNMIHRKKEDPRLLEHQGGAKARAIEVTPEGAKS